MYRRRFETPDGDVLLRGALNGTSNRFASNQMQQIMSSQNEIPVQPVLLIVEDEVMVALDMKSSLIGLGYRVSGIAATSAQTLEMIEEENQI